jgi:hypothetical protein
VPRERERAREREREREAASVERLDSEEGERGREGGREEKQRERYEQKILWVYIYVFSKCSAM